MAIFIVSFLSGVLTILAPCVLPVLPVILGGTLSESNYKRIITIILSFIVSIIAFTFLLKVSTAFINIDPRVRTALSGVILIVFSLVTLFPTRREKLKLLIPSKTGRSSTKRSDTLQGQVILGMSLGPIFSSCSPTYSLIIATILPLSLRKGTISIILYAVGLGLSVGIVAVFGKKVTSKLRSVSDSNGIFKKILGIIILLTGIAIISGYDKVIETAIVDNSSFDVTKIEQLLLNQTDMTNEKEGDKFTQAPELTGLTNWINTSGYTSMQDLRGKVVLIDFWTYSCINCQRTLPYLQSWHEKYASSGLVIIGVHAPEFSFERKKENLLNASKQFGLTYPIVQDNNFTLWRAYHNKYRPAKYLIDQDGNIVYTHFGEGKYAETEETIQKLLHIDQDITKLTNKEKIGPITPETYLGTKRRIDQRIRSIEGDRQDNAEYIALSGSSGSIVLNFTGSEVHLVLSNVNQGSIQTVVDNQTGQSITLDGDNLYTLYRGDYGTHRIEIYFDQADAIRAHAFTFG